MASTIKKPAKLADLLQQQQEPFVLGIYLHEKSFNLKSNREGSSDTFKSSSIWGHNRSKKGTISCSKVLRSVYKKVVSRNRGPTNKNSESKEADGQQIGESDRFSSASSRTQYDSCSEGDKVDETLISFQNDHDASLAVPEETAQVSRVSNMKKIRKIERFNGETSKLPYKQNSFISALADKHSHADARPLLHNRQELPAMSREEESPSPSPSTCSVILRNKITEDSILSASLCELLFYPKFEKQRGFGVSGKPETVEPIFNPSPHLRTSKRVLQQTRQLPFDCVREMTETNAKKVKEQQHSHKRLMGAEEIGKLVCEKLGMWGKQTVNEGTIDFLLGLDVTGSGEEWYENYPRTERNWVGNWRRHFRRDDRRNYP